MDVAEIQVGQLHVKDEVGIRCQKLFQDFLEEFREDGKAKYIEASAYLADAEHNSLEVNFDDLEKYNQNLAGTIIEEYYRVYPFLCKAAANFAKDHIGVKVPKEVYVSFLEVPTRHNLRELTTEKIGTLVRFTAQVVRTHPVHPELISGTFVCLDCQTVVSNVEQQFKFTNPTICRNPVCSNRRRFMLDTDKSVFVDFQKIRVQETQAELPRGCIPRSVEVILRAETVELVQAGDKYDFTGTLIVVPDVGALSMPGARAELGSRHKGGDTNAEGVRGLKALGVRELHYRLAFLACSVHATAPRFGGSDLIMEEVTAETMKEQMTDAEWNKIYDMSRDKNLYMNLTNSLFPSIHGNDEVKKGIILLLFGGVPKTTQEGTTLRGDINCCIVGDPSTAKSQLLKQVADFSPRAVYTSGKASTAAGLTAAVVRDEESSDFVIEAGALMLADNGVCCIDEFDKMDPKDQVAIHEAMEQQTISLAKAGVRATLNARTSILAAANPIGGRYDRTKSLQQNISLTAPIMSRFDLFFILIDECDQGVDYCIAQKIVELHCNNFKPDEQAYTREDVLRYITFARQFKPIISEEAADLLVEQYHHLRQRDKIGTAKSTWRITVRQLESMIRLSEAMAKMECSDEVLPKHVKEAYRLLNKSIIRVEQPDIHFDDPDETMDVDDVQPQEEHDSEVPATPLTNEEATKQKKKGNTMSYEEYKNIADAILLYLKSEEEKSERGESTSEGVTRTEISAWYLEQIQESLESEVELLEKKKMVEKVIDRLTYKDNILIPLTQSGIEGDERSSDTDPVLVIHPNFIVE